jgi:uncharacterized GH25 family protein
MRRVCFVLGILAVPIAASLGSAHDLKVLASRWAFDAKGGKSTIYLSWGHHLPVDDLVDAAAIERYDLLTPDGSAKPLKKTDLSLQTNVVQLDAEGVHQVIVCRKVAVFTFVVDEEGNRVMKRGPKSAVKEGAIDYSLRSQQFAKALLVAGTAKKETVKPAGLPLEIVPVEEPAKWCKGDLHFRVLFQGKPLGEEMLTATRIGFQPADAWCYATSTNHAGEAVVRADQAGIWVLRVHVRKPARGAAREQYDYESYTSTLTLEVRP